MEHINVAMIVNKMTFQEAAELYPKKGIQTSNRFALLESTVEFPQLEQPSTTNTKFRHVNKTTTKLDYKTIIRNMNTNETQKQHKTRPEIQKTSFQQQKPNKYE